jgi:transcriptional regulator with XRE-family HTH domain
VTNPETAFGLVVKEARLLQGVSQQELSFRAEIHWSYVSQLERGIKSPSLGVVFRIASALGMPASSLLLTVEQRLRQS